jgi:signal transduction histidine kinase
VDWAVTSFAATATTELVAALLMGALVLRRPGERPLGLAALIALGAAARSAALLVAMHSTTPGATALAQRAGDVLIVLATAVGVHFSVVYAGRRLAPWSWMALYAVAFGWPALSLPVRVADALGTTATLALAAWSTRNGTVGAVPVLAGAAAWFTTALADLFGIGGALPAGSVVDAGLAAFVLAVATVPSARLSTTAAELDRRNDELRTRSLELRRSYEDLRTAQEELRKREQLAVVGELAAVIAHEVRNPLAVIANAGAGLRKAAISREDQDILLAILDEETSRLNRLVSDLLRYARPVSVQRTHVGLRELLERTLAAMATSGGKAVRTELTMQADEGRLWGDANLLRQVFDNLLDNAVQAMPEGGQLTVRVRAASKDGVDGLAVDIIDTGEGMDTHVRSRALDPFFTTRPSGTGLGLAIVDRIVEAHGGYLEIDSRAGEGTTVTVFLPSGSPSEPPPVRLRSHRPASLGK